MAWKPLHVSASAAAHLPALLISTSFTNDDSYTIHLSDLTSIWSESLDRSAIIRRSRDESTSIDPSDGDQFKIFRDKVKLGLEGGENTALALTVLADPTRPSLVLHITVNLPGGLAPLEWPIRLAPGSQSAFTSQLITPLLRAQHGRMQEMASLTEILKEKDTVIQKLLDTLETQGTDLAQVFPQAAGRVGRKFDRKKAAERVRSLAPFNVGVWRENLAHYESRDTAQLIKDVFGGKDDSLALEGGEQVQEEEEDADEWWDNIKGITVSLDTGKISTRGPPKPGRRTTPLPKPAVVRQESTNDDDAFQVQFTPPHLKVKASTSKAVPEESTDDDDLDVPSQLSTQRSKIPDSYPKSPSPPPKAPSPKSARKFGKLGGRKAPPAPPPMKEDESTDDEEHVPQATRKKASTMSDEAMTSDDEPTVPPPKSANKAPSQMPEPVPKPQKKFGKIGSKKEPPPPPPPESETDDEPEAQPEPEPSPPPRAATPPAARPKKAKFGQIGGKKKAAEAIPIPEELVAESSTASAAPKKKFGAIGHKSSPLKAIKPEPSSQNAEREETRGRAPIKAEKEPTPPRETSEERANKKREQLKRVLEEKAKAGPKKKRKF